MQTIQHLMLSRCIRLFLTDHNVSVAGLQHLLVLESAIAERTEEQRDTPATSGRHFQITMGACMSNEDGGADASEETDSV